MRILTLDCGTSRIKAGVFDISTDQPVKGTLHSAVKAPVRLWIEKTDGPATEGTLALHDHSHLDVDMYIKRVMTLLSRVTEELKEDGLSVDALCPAFCCPALVALDEHLRPMYPALSHLHRACQPQAEELANTIGRERWLRTTGNLPFPGGISASSLHWLTARHPHVVANTAHWVHLHSLLLYELTGKLVTDPTQAAYTGAYDVLNAGGWLDDEWLKLIGLRREQLAEIVPSASIAGNLKASAARQSGLPRGLPVITGGADIPIALLAAEDLLSGCFLNMIGTTEIDAASHKGRLEPGENYLLRPHVVPGSWVVVKVSPISGETLFWFHDRYCREMSPGRFWDWVLRLDVRVEQIIEDQKLAVEGEENLEFIPYLFGDRHSLQPRKAAFIGLTAETTREDMLCAVLAAYSVRLHEAAYEVSTAIGRPPDRVVTSGGYDISSLGFHRRSALNRSTLTPLETAVIRGAAVLAATTLEKA